MSTPPSSDRSNTLDRAKRQAKRLLTLGQKGPLVIQQLHQAQAITAQLFGYPTWHAMEQAERPCPAHPSNTGETTPAATAQSFLTPGSIRSQLRGSPELILLGERRDLDFRKAIKEATTPPSTPSFNYIPALHHQGDVARESLKDMMAQCHEVQRPFTVVSRQTPPHEFVDGLALWTTHDLMDGFSPLFLPLGMVHPEQHLRLAIEGWVRALLYPNEDGQREGTLPGLIHRLIELLYELRSPQGNPVPYARGILRDVDELVGPEPQAKLTWWDVTDMLMTRDHPVLAAKAQSLASPNLHDLAIVANSEAMRELYSRLRDQMGWPILDGLNKRLNLVLQASPELNLSDQVRMPLWAAPRHLWLLVDTDPSVLRGMSAEARWALAILMVHMTDYRPDERSTAQDPGFGKVYEGPFEALIKQEKDSAFLKGTFDYAHWHEQRQGGSLLLPGRVTWFEGLEDMPTSMTKAWNGLNFLIRESRKRAQTMVFAWTPSGQRLDDHVLAYTRALSDMKPGKYLWPKIATADFRPEKT